MTLMMITLGMPIQLPDPSDATEHGESGTPELLRSGVLQIGIIMMMMMTRMMMIMVTMMMMMMTLISLVIIR